MLDDPRSRPPHAQAESRLSSPLRDIVADARAFASCEHLHTVLVVSGEGRVASRALYLCAECGCWKFDGDPAWHVPLLARRLGQLVAQFEKGTEDDLDPH